MIYIVIIAVLIVAIIYVLYQIGKNVKKKEQRFQDMFKEQEARNRLKKYKRKSTPKVPTIKK